MTGWPVMGLVRFENGLSTRSMPSTASSAAAYANERPDVGLRDVGSPWTSARIVMGVVSPGGNAFWRVSDAAR